MFWGGKRDKLPAGWAECYGQSAPTAVKDFTGLSTIPDLREYMPAGAGGKFGTNVGEKKSSRTKKHKHLWGAPSDRKGYPTKSADSSEGGANNQSYWRGNKYNSHDTSKGATYTQEVGNDFTAPPVWIGIYIMKVA